LPNLLKAEHTFFENMLLKHNYAPLLRVTTPDCNNGSLMFPWFMHR